MYDIIQSYKNGTLKTSVTNDNFYINVLKDLPLKNCVNNQGYIHPFDDLLHVYDNKNLYKFQTIAICHAATNIINDKLIFNIETEKGEKVNFYL